MEDQTKIEEVTTNIKNYVNTNIELVKMEVIENTTIIASNLVSGLVIAIVGIFFMLFLSLAAAFFLSTYLSDFYLGFLCVALFYLILWIVFIVGKHKLLEKPINNKIIRKVFSKKEY
jgi:hypothetical protein